MTMTQGGSNLYPGKPLGAALASAYNIAFWGTPPLPGEARRSR